MGFVVLIWADRKWLDKKANSGSVVEDIEKGLDMRDVLAGLMKLSECMESGGE